MATRDGLSHWWQRAIIYQVYPRSYQDTNGDGVGDLAGVHHRLDHIAALGIDTIWLSPIFPSPMADFGYDVADYGDIDARFGTMADFDRLIAAVHARGMRLLLDFVPNHSSSQHPWFVASRSARSNPKRDWYIWRDPAADGGGGRPTIGSAISAAAPGSSTRAPNNITCIPSSRSSPTSTGATPQCVTLCSTCCASGWGVGSTASAST